jgi:hypothetical protein
LDTRDFIVSQLECISLMSKRNLQFEIDLQNFTDSNHNQLQNILIRVSNPTKTSENISRLLLTAHYDSGKLISKSNHLIMFDFSGI